MNFEKEVSRYKKARRTGAVWFTLAGLSLILLAILSVHVLSATNPPVEFIRMRVLTVTLTLIGLIVVSIWRLFKGFYQMSQISNSFFSVVERSLRKNYIFEFAESPVRSKTNINWLENAVNRNGYNGALISLMLCNGEKALFNVVIEGNQAFLETVPKVSETSLEEIMK